MSKTFTIILYALGSILGFLVVLCLLLPYIIEFKGKDSERAAVELNIKSIGLAMIVYAEENDGEFPDMLSELYPDYISIGNLKCFSYPNEKEEIVTPKNIDSSSCFECMDGLTWDVGPNTVIVREKSNDHWKELGRYEVLVDGSVRWTGKLLLNTGG